MITTVGKETVRAALPDKYRQYADRPLDAPAVSAMMTQLAKEDPDKYIEVLQRLNDIGQSTASLYGREASIGLSDYMATPAVRKLQQELRGRVAQVFNHPGLSSDEKLDKVRDMVGQVAGDLPDAVYEELAKTDNALAQQVRSGGRGSKAQLVQSVLGDLVSAEIGGRPIPYPGLRSYGGGLSPFDYWINSYAVRRAYINMQQATSRAGYLGKMLSNVAHRMVVTGKDCGTADGLRVDGDDPNNIGSVLQRAEAGLPAGTVIAPEHLELLADRNIFVRSPLACRAKEGVCQICAGIRERGRFPDLGEPIGLNAVRSFVEPLTQAGLRSKHISAAGEKQTAGGIKEVEQFVQIPRHFPGGAVLAGADGTVGRVFKAPQGGMYVMVGAQQYHVPREQQATVKAGDYVEAGDVLSSGLPNPAEIARYKGIGAGRKYFLDRFRSLLDRNNAGTHRRNLELFARALVSKVQVTDPAGANGHMVGDVVDYDELVSGWEPREGSQLKSTTTAGNLYLERPYLHYSLGTRVTPSVAKRLQEDGVKEVLVHQQPPPFEPMMVRAQDFTQHDKDWMVRLGGEQLERSLLSAARRGSSSERKGTSYYPTLVNLGA